VIHDLNAGLTQTGLEEIGARIRYFNTQDFKVKNTSAAIRQDAFVAHFVKFGGGEAAFPGLVVYQLKDGKVLNQWVYDTASSAATQSPAAVTDEALVADLAALMSNPYGATKVAALYAPNAVIHDLVENITQTGLEEIGARIRYFNTQDFKVVVTSAPIRQDNFVANFAKFGNTSELSGRGLVVYELKDGKVQNQWVYDATWSGATQLPAAVTDEALVADLAAVMSNPYDAARVAALFAPNAVLYDKVANETSTGLGAIQAKIRYLNTQDFKVVVTSAPIRQDNFVANFVKFGTGEAAFPGLVVYELLGGKVLNQWVYPAP
jgi:menaquinone-dependent protoporphyrinogen IX oxidase